MTPIRVLPHWQWAMIAAVVTLLASGLGDDLALRDEKGL